MKRKFFLFGIFAVVVTAALAGPRTPRLATIRGQDGSLRPVWGVPYSLVNGGPLPVGNVKAAAFSDSAGIVLSRGAIRMLTVDGLELGSYSTFEGKPALSISGPANTAIAWLPSEGKLIRWDDSRFIATKIDAAAFAGSVADICMSNDGQIELLLSGNDGSITRAHFSLREARVSSEEVIPSLSKHAIQVASSLVFHDANGLEIESPNGAMKTLPLREADVTYERAGAHCVHLMSASDGRQWLLHLDYGSEPALSEIPPVPPSTSTSTGEAK